jgi:hypothetical protein
MSIESFKAHHPRLAATFAVVAVFAPLPPALAAGLGWYIATRSLNGAVQDLGTVAVMTATILAGGALADKVRNKLVP